MNESEHAPLTIQTYLEKMLTDLVSFCVFEYPLIKKQFDKKFYFSEFDLKRAVFQQHLNTLYTVFNEYLDVIEPMIIKPAKIHIAKYFLSEKRWNDALQFAPFLLEDADIELTEEEKGNLKFSANTNRKFPEACYCPLMGEIMVDPVILFDGSSFERGAITAYLMFNREHPITHEKIISDRLYEQITSERLFCANFALRNAIEHLRSDSQDMPHEYKCPISQMIMVSPCLLEDGQTYEQEEIEEWLKTHNTSPKTGKQLSSKELIPNHNLQALIEDYLKQHPELYNDELDVYLPKSYIASFKQAVTSNNLQAVQMWLAKDRRLINKQLGSEADTALYIAIRNNNIELVKFLLENDADITSYYRYVCLPKEMALFLYQNIKIITTNHLTDYFDKLRLYLREKAFRSAVYDNDTDIVKKWLDIDKGSNFINEKIDSSNTALDIAVKRKYSELVKLLLEYGASIHISNANDFAYFEYCSFYSCKKIESALSKYLQTLDADTLYQLSLRLIEGTPGVARCGIFILKQAARFGSMQAFDGWVILISLAKHEIADEVYMIQKLFEKSDFNVFFKWIESSEYLKGVEHSKIIHKVIVESSISAADKYRLYLEYKSHDAGLRLYEDRAIPLLEAAAKEGHKQAQKDYLAWGIKSSISAADKYRLYLAYGKEMNNYNTHIFHEGLLLLKAAAKEGHNQACKEYLTWRIESCNEMYRSDSLLDIFLLPARLLAYPFDVIAVFAGHGFYGGSCRFPHESIIFEPLDGLYKLHSLIALPAFILSVFIIPLLLLPISIPLTLLTVALLPLMKALANKIIDWQTCQNTQVKEEPIGHDTNTAISPSLGLSTPANVASVNPSDAPSNERASYSSVLQPSPSVNVSEASTASLPSQTVSS